ADDIQGAVGAKWAKHLGVKKVYILNDQELYGKGIADVFEATAKKIGLPVVANEGIDWKQPDQKPVLTKIRASGADLIYLGRVIIDAIKRAAPAIEQAKDATEKREAVRKAIAATKNFEGINGKWSFDENGDVDYDTMSGFKVVKADGPIGCKFQFETILE